MSDQSHPGRAPVRLKGRSYLLLLGSLALALAAAWGGTCLAVRLRGTDEKSDEVKVKFPGRYFKDWGKPDLVLVLTGNQQGYLQPCGCSRPQVGGLERRHNLMRLLRSAGWPVVGLDLGDITQRRGPAELANADQTLLKYLFSMRALKTMGYQAVGIGVTEANLGLSSVLAEYALNEPEPAVVTSNLMDAEKNFPLQTKPWVPIDVKEADMRVGVSHIVGPTVDARIKEVTHGDKLVRFGETTETLKNVVAQMKKSKVHLPVLLYQGPQHKAEDKADQTEAIGCAKKHPYFPLVVALSDDDEPLFRPSLVKTDAGTSSWVVTVGRKGKYVSVVGAYKTDKADQPYTYRYERVELSEDFLTPDDEAKDNPIQALMEEYTAKLRDDKYLAKYARVKHENQVLPDAKGLKKQPEVKYVGSETCKECHEHAYAVWAKSGHAHAYETLAKAKRPSNANFDPECVVCHSVGFGIQSGFVDAKTTPLLKDVGCESCHGPCSVHVAHNYNKEWHKRINPWKYQPAEKKELAIDLFCQKCHDIDNDVHWLHGGFKKKWPKVEHAEPKPKAKDD